MGCLGLVRESSRAVLLSAMASSLLDRHGRAAVVSLLVLHVAGTMILFPPRALRSPDPITSGDGAYHYYQTLAVHRILNRGGHPWGYDPFFMAGYPAGVPFDVDAKGAELFCHAFSRLGFPQAFKAWALIALLLAPAMLYAAGRALGLTRAEATAAVGLALLYWHFGRPFLGHLRWAGKHSFLLASGLCVLVLALIWRALDARGRGRIGWLAGGTALAAAAWQISPLALPMLVPGLLVLLAGALRRLRLRDHGAIALGLALVVLVNAGWIVPMLRLHDARLPTSYWLQLRGLQEIAFVYTRKTSIVFAAITVLGCWGLMLLGRRHRSAGAALAVTGAAWFLAAFFGARVPALARIDPGR